MWGTCLMKSGSLASSEGYDPHTPTGPMARFLDRANEPGLFVAASDSKHFWNLAPQIYRFNPIPYSGICECVTPGADFFVPTLGSLGRMPGSEGASATDKAMPGGTTAAGNGVNVPSTLEFNAQRVLGGTGIDGKLNGSTQSSPSSRRGSASTNGVPRSNLPAGNGAGGLRDRRRPHALGESSTDIRVVECSMGLRILNAVQIRFKAGFLKPGDG